MDRLRVVLLNASNDANTPRNFRRELDADLTEFDVHEELPDTFAFDAAVVTGSRASVYCDEPWIESLVEWVDEAAEREMPILGICFGHQVLAKALGGRVEDMGDYEIGYREVDGEGLLFDDTMTVFTTHSDAVTDLPPGAERTAENDYGVHGFRDGNAFGVQFHPEYDMQTARTVTKGKDLPDERIETVLSGITEANYAAACEAKGLFETFTEYAREVREGQSAVGSNPT